MKSFKICRGLLAILVSILVALSATAQPPSTSAIEWVEKLQTTYDKIDSFSAYFRQIFRGLNLRLEESGKLWMKKPGKMRWEYQQPFCKLFVSDGLRIYFYVPRDNQVMVADLSPDLADTPLLFLMGRGEIQKDFEVAWEKEEESLIPGNPLLRLAPKILRAHFSLLLVEIDPALVRIHRLTVIEPLGNRNDYILTNWRENIRIDDKKFSFQIPADAEVLQASS